MTMRYHWSRAPGARTPKSARAVTRSTPYGNPFPIVHQRCLLPKNYRQKYKNPQLHEVAVLLFEAYYEHDPAYRAMIRRDLHGKGLKCPCPLEWPCHIDVLLKWAAHGP